MGFTYKRNLEEQSEENFQSLVKEIVKTREKKRKNPQSTERRKPLLLKETLFSSETDIVNRLRTFDSQPISKTESPKEDINIKNKFQYSSSFVARKELSVLKNNKEDCSAFTRMLLLSKNTASSGKLKQIDFHKIVSGNNLRSSSKQYAQNKPGQKKPKRESSTKQKQSQALTPGKGTRILKHLGMSLLLKDMPSLKNNPSPKGQSQVTATTVATSTTTANPKKVLSQAKPGSSKSKLNLNFKDLAAKSKCLDTKLDPVNKRSFKHPS